MLALEDLGGGDPRVVVALDTIAITVVATVVAHGITSRPLATRHVRSTRSIRVTATPDRGRGERDLAPAG